MIYQTDRNLDANLNAIGCAFDSLAFFRERYQNIPWSASELQAAWDGALKLGIISPDANSDGDVLDNGEGEIQDWQLLANHLGCEVKFLGFYPPNAQERAGNFVIARWFNARTNFRHFVVGDTRPVEWDPIKGGSVTVREGVVDSLRIFTPLAEMV
jgi:hypothetical protein